MNTGFEELAWGIVRAYNLDLLPKMQREQVFQWTITGHRQGDPRRVCPVCNMMTVAHAGGQQEGL